MKFQNSIVSLIDFDSCIYIVAHKLKDETDVDVCNSMVDTWVTTILNNTNCSHYLGFLGGSKCFRHNLTAYKANRGDKQEHVIRWEPIIRHRLITKWGFTVCDSIEAEDGLSIAYYKYRDLTNLVICHIDKDSNCLEGNHYNFSSHTFWYTDKIGRLYWDGKKKDKLKGTGLKWQYAQLIVGDSTDGIKGLIGKGPVFAYKLLDDCQSEYSLFRRTYCAYLAHCKEKDIKEYFKLQWSLIVMLTEEAHGFVLPELIEYKKEVNKDLEDILKDWI